jgi:hypothetical protein
MARCSIGLGACRGFRDLGAGSALRSAPLLWMRDKVLFRLSEQRATTSESAE